MTLHDDQPEIDDALVRRLLRAQLPDLAGLPLRRLDSAGSTNAIHRLGTGFTVRLPLTAGGAEGVHREARWAPVLARAGPLPVPEVVATGEPGEGYPWPWAVHRWIDGEVLAEGRVPDPGRTARDLGAFVVALRGVDPAGAPPAHRAGPLAGADAEVRDAIDRLRHGVEPLDAGAATAAWEAALAVPGPTGPPVWVHADLMPGNLLARGGRLAAVLDLATAGLGDPAVDLVPAWNLLPPPAVAAFRSAVDADDATWARGRGWALAMALVQLPYYRDSHPVIAANARHVLGRILGDG